MPDQKTIDRVCVGLADLAMQEYSFRTSHIRVADEVVRLGIPASYGFLLILLSIPEPIPDWAERALEGHHGTPEELVAVLQELAGKEVAKLLQPQKQGVCAICGGDMSLLTPEYFAARGMPGKRGGWIHNGVERDHPATPKGEMK